MKNELKELREKSGFTQKQAADYLGLSLRSYIMYENEKYRRDSIKYRYIVEKLSEKSFIDETHGVLSITYIKDVVHEVLSEYEVEYCYLFGSYAKGNPTEKSDVDLLISGNVNGLKFYGIVEKMRERLNKRIDLLKVNQLENNIELLNEILKDGIKIYEIN